MKLKMLLIITLLAGIFLSEKAYAQDVVFSYFNLNSDGADVLLEWEVQEEANIERFELYRKFNDEGTFIAITTFTPNGTRQYQFLDDDIFKNLSRTIFYELHVVIKGKTDPVIVTNSLLHSPTSVQRTWGSIKAMFR
ncbi:MAG: hypothetical protein AAF824_23700 [Bacteroidota bacterium]